MKKFNFNFVGNIKKYLIASGTILLIGLILAFALGIETDINFSGGSRFTYTYEGELDLDDVQKVADKTLGKKTSVSNSESAVDAGSSKIVISAAEVVASDEKDEEGAKKGTQVVLEEALQKEFKDNKIAFAESNVIEPSIAHGFYAKSIVAILISAVLVIVYIGFRFRKIGGFSAALFAWVALIHDVIIAFLACVVFRLQIDINFVAVLLTILGYSLNDTVIIYDRIRENRTRNRSGNLAEVVNTSINETLNRTIITTITTFVAVIVVAVVAEFFGLTALRSFAIPMAFGMISGSYSSICLSGPLWVKWNEFSYNRKLKKENNK